MKLKRNYEKSILKKVEVELEKLLAISAADKDTYSIQHILIHQREIQIRFNFFSLHIYVHAKLNTMDHKIVDKIVIRSWADEEFFNPEDYKKVAAKIQEQYDTMRSYKVTSQKQNYAQN